MKKYRSKPVEIEAVQFDGSNGYQILEWAGPRCGMEERFTSNSKIRNIIVVQTLEGEMRAVPSDWVIKGTEGEFYPCKDSVFQRKYEAVE